MANPLREQRAIELDALTRIHDRLPIQRDVICELRDQHVREQSRAREAALDGTTRRCCLCDVIAARAGEFGPHMTDHAEASRYVLQLFGNVFAQQLQLAAAFRARLGRFRQMRLHLTRQMLRQRFARRLFRRRARCLGDFDRSGAFVGLQLFEPQFELLDLAVQFLRLATELHAAQLRNQQLQMLDLRLGGGVCRLMRFDYVLEMPNASIALEQHGFERFDVVWIGVGRGHAGSLRGGQHVYNADVGSVVRIGWRQSIPSSSIDRYGQQSHRIVFTGTQRSTPFE